MIHEIIGRTTLGTSFSTSFLELRDRNLKNPNTRRILALQDSHSSSRIHPKRRPKKCQGVAGWHPWEAPGVCLGLPGFMGPMGILMARHGSFAIEQQYISLPPPTPKKKKRKNNYFQLFEQTIRQNASTVKNVCSAHCKHKSWCIEFDANMLIHSLTLTVARAT